MNHACQWSKCWHWLILSTVVILSSSGCQLFDRFRQTRPQVPVAFESQPTLEQLIAGIQRHTEQVRQIKTSVRVSMDGLPATLRGDLQVERPMRMRLQAGVMSMNELGFDLGSNDDSFWIWQKASLPGNPPILYYSRHVDFQTSPMQQLTQLQPQWLLDALGFLEFRPSDRHVGPVPRNDGYVEIQSYLQTPTGTRVRVCVVDPQRAIVLRQTHYDAQGKLIAYIDSAPHIYLPDQQASLPQQIEIHVANPQGGYSRLTVNADNYQLNALYGDPQKLWEMPNPPDVTKVNLSQL